MTTVGKSDKLVYEGYVTDGSIARPGNGYMASECRLTYIQDVITNIGSCFIGALTPECLSEEELSINW